MLADDADLIAFVPSSDLDRSLEFYGGTLGLELESRDQFACQFPGLRVTLVDEPARAPYTVLGWRVDDIEACVRWLASRGVRFEIFDRMEQDELRIWTSPGGGRIAWFKDPDGNTLSLGQLP
jgi:catechol 2,3-dioxygenase-like lactoylglutathione lyase family enzyme